MTNAGDLLDAIAKPTRRVIVEHLAARPSSVSDIARELPISRSAVSQHLQILKGVGLVHDHAEGVRRIYRVDPDALAIIRAYFDSFWRRSLDSFRNAVEQPTAPAATPHAKHRPAKHSPPKQPPAKQPPAKNRSADQLPPTP